MAIIKKHKGQLTLDHEHNSIADADIEVTLPTTISVPKTRLQDYTILLYGEKKIGKTSMWKHAEHTFFLMFEPGGKALRIYQKNVTRWSQFVGYVNLLEKDTTFQTVVVDPVDIAYDLCFQHMLDKLHIEHPTDENDFGKSWRQIEREFTLHFLRLLALDKGIILIAHAVDRETKTKLGQKFIKTAPEMPGQAARFFEGIVDVWAHYGYRDGKRVILLRGDDRIAAGCRLEENFLTIGGKPLISIPAGTSSEQAYTFFMQAFNNQLTYSTAERYYERSAESK